VELLENERPDTIPPSALRDCADILQCPLTGGLLVPSDSEWIGAGGRRYPVNHRIPDLFLPLDSPISHRDVTEIVKAYYEETPFPNYDDVESRQSLVAKSRRSQLASALDEQLPDGAIVLDAGCGTGQLTNFLGLAWNRRVFGGDISLNSLYLANEFRERYRIVNTAFLQMNLFRPPFRDGSVDVVIANSVLHHTGDPRRGFEALLGKVKPGGFILIGLYNRYGRLPTLGRRWVFKTLGRPLYFLGRRLNSSRLSAVRWEGWFRDQHHHPHETQHSIDEILGWFDASGVDFMSSIPAAHGAPFTDQSRLFEPHSRGSTSVRAAAQLNLMLTGGHDCGLFVMIGRKRL
jgi:SAM-dependent methyltransferase